MLLKKSERGLNTSMRTIYLDCPTGISGDMCLAALIDLGVDFQMIKAELEKLPVDRIDVRIGKEVRHSVTGTTFRVNIEETHHHRTFDDIRKMIAKSALSPSVKETSTAIFKLIAEAEGKVHGIDPGKVHFHEVGAMDSIIDIVGAAVAFDSLKAEAIVCSPLPLGSGLVKTMHGTMPIPAPATLEILKGVPVRLSEIPFELTTPTGAAIVKTLCTFGPMPSMTIEKIGYGAGKKDFKEASNLVRAVIGTSDAGSQASVSGRQTLTVLETNIDDMTPQVGSYLMERLLERGALDAFYTPVVMKKSRPGLLLTVLANSTDSSSLTDIILDESTSIGVRSYQVERECLERKFFKVETSAGTVQVKVSYRNGAPVNVQPEYEDCKRLAMDKKLPLKNIIDEAKAAFSKL